MGIIIKITKFIGFSALVFVGVLLGPNPLPPGVSFTEFHVAPAKYAGEDIGALSNVERLFEGEIKGPEAFEIVNGVMYTTLHGGYLAKVFDDQVIPVVKFGEPCEGWWEESKCGRPLGLKAFQDRYLFVADAYYGIFRYDTRTGEVTQLVSKDIIIDGRKPKIFNSVEVAKDGTVYWTHSSSDFSLEDGIFTFLADGSGRLIKYDPQTHKNVVLMKDLFFANGVVLSDEEDFLLVAETGHSRIHRYFLKGSKSFTSEIFVDGLPGMPDNLRRRTKGDFLVPLVIARDENHPALFQVISPFPTLRKFFARFLCLIQLTIHKLNTIYSNYYIKRALHYVGHLESVTPFLPQKVTVLVIDLQGNIVKNYVGYDGSVSSVSDVIVFKNHYLYFASPTNNYLGRIKLPMLSDYQNERIRVSTTGSAPTTTPTRPPPPPTTQAPRTTRPPPPSTTQAPRTTRPPPPSTTQAPRTTRPPTTTSTSRPSPPPSPRTTSSHSTTTPRPDPPRTPVARPVTAAPNAQPNSNTREESHKKS